MCEATAFILKDGQEEVLMEAVDIIEPEGDGLRLVSIFGDQKVVRAGFHCLNLGNHRVILKERKNSP